MAVSHGKNRLIFTHKFMGNILGVRMRYLLLLCLLGLFVGCDNGSPPIEFEYKGMKVGDPVDSKGWSWQPFNDEPNGKSGIFSKNDDGFTQVFVIDGKFHGVSANGMDVARNREAHKVKYGEPHSTSSDGGLSWRSNNGRLRVNGDTMEFMTKEVSKRYSDHCTASVEKSVKEYAEESL